MKSRRMRWVGHVEHMGRGRNLYRAFWVNMKEGENLEGLDIDGSKILKLILEVESKSTN